MKARLLTRKDIRPGHCICILDKSVYTKPCSDLGMGIVGEGVTPKGGLRGLRLPYDSGDFNDFCRSVYT